MTSKVEYDERAGDAPLADEHSSPIQPPQTPLGEALSGTDHWTPIGPQGWLKVDPRLESFKKYSVVGVTGFEPATPTSRIQL